MADVEAASQGNPALVILIVISTIVFSILGGLEPRPLLPPTPRPICDDRCRRISTESVSVAGRPLDPYRCSLANTFLPWKNLFEASRQRCARPGQHLESVFTWARVVLTLALRLPGLCTSGFTCRRTRISSGSSPRRRFSSTHIQNTGGHLTPCVGGLSAAFWPYSGQFSRRG